MNLFMKFNSKHFLTCCRIGNCFFRAFIKNISLYRHGSVKCDIAIDVSEENEDISTNNFHELSRTSTDFKKMYFICHDKHISDNSAYNKDGIG